MNKDDLMFRLEKKFGRYAIPNLTLVLIALYIIGYITEIVNPEFVYYLSLDSERIVHGQIWRLFTWLIIPPSSFDVFTLLMLYFYYSIGTVMERTLGTFRYNVYLLGGFVLTVTAAFVCLAAHYLFPELLGPTYQTIVELGGDAQLYFMDYFNAYSLRFSTYYINISIFLAFAACYPEQQVLLMYVIPVKVKWMGLLDLGLLLYMLYSGDIFARFAVGAALLNFALFYLSLGRLSHMKPAQIKRRAEFQRKVKSGVSSTRHKCSVCGQTEETSPDLEFRFCSKCVGNYEYCMQHLYTHEHVK